ncbi:hypothetical protein AB835_04890 [Candidatus Endobugula sertula]|uniref:Uncharacterized protein n=1 Tax=Candidatus Endobugula sertula TaxID=62101 RepID=A0A1D2QRK7_9GAMM|nr:hypothetical protein AB835_04890 [Candidatus Endobugula sertula]
MVEKLSISQLFVQGKTYYDQEDYQSALRAFYKVWIQLPKPENHQQNAGQILTFIGSTYFKLQRYQPAIEALRRALACKDNSCKLLTLLRLGQCLLEEGQEYQGRTYLQRAYRIGGAQVFDQEDSKYKKAIIDLVA